MEPAVRWAAAGHPWPAGRSFLSPSQQTRGSNMGVTSWECRPLASGRVRDGPDRAALCGRCGRPPRSGGSAGSESVAGSRPRWICTLKTSQVGPGSSSCPVGTLSPRGPAWPLVSRARCWPPPLAAPPTRPVTQALQPPASRILTASAQESARGAHASARGRALVGGGSRPGPGGEGVRAPPRGRAQDAAIAEEETINSFLPCPDNGRVLWID